MYISNILNNCYTNKIFFLFWYKKNILLRQYWQNLLINIKNYLYNKKTNNIQQQLTWQYLLQRQIIGTAIFNTKGQCIHYNNKIIQMLQCFEIKNIFQISALFQHQKNIIQFVSFIMKLSQQFERSYNNHKHNTYYNEFNISQSSNPNSFCDISNHYPQHEYTTLAIHQECTFHLHFMFLGCHHYVLSITNTNHVDFNISNPNTENLVKLAAQATYQSSHLYCAVNMNNKIIDCNHAFAKYYHTLKQNIIDKSINQILFHTTDTNNNTTKTTINVNNFHDTLDTSNIAPKNIIHEDDIDHTNVLFWNKCKLNKNRYLPKYYNFFAKTDIFASRYLHQSLVMHKICQATLASTQIVKLYLIYPQSLENILFYSDINPIITEALFGVAIINKDSIIWCNNQFLTDITKSESCVDLKNYLKQDSFVVLEKAMAEILQNKYNKKQIQIKTNNDRVFTFCLKKMSISADTIATTEHLIIIYTFASSIIETQYHRHQIIFSINILKDLSMNIINNLNRYYIDIITYSDLLLNPKLIDTTNGQSHSHLLTIKHLTNKSMHLVELLKNYLNKIIKNIPQ